LERQRLAAEAAKQRRLELEVVRKTYADNFYCESNIRLLEYYEEAEEEALRLEAEAAAQK